MLPTGTVNVAVVGASGYTGAELLRLLLGHPRVTISVVTSEKSVGQPVASVFPHLASLLPLSFEALSPETLSSRVDAVFLALPHTKSLAPAAACRSAGLPVVDLSADYRLKDPTLYEQWYQTPHPHLSLLKEAVYGLPELHRREIQAARLVATPGCYPTAALLQLAPLVAKGLIQPDCVVIDAKSGISGAGRSPAPGYHFPEAHESIEAYKVGQHRHTPEIEQELTRLAAKTRSVDPAPVPAHNMKPWRVIFSPHLAPMNRGILSTAYCRLIQPAHLADLNALFKDYYKGERFIRVQESLHAISPRHVRGSNFCDLAVVTDPRSGWVVTVAALDNLVKGAAGQAIQALNLMLGFPEEIGLTAPTVYP